MKTIETKMQLAKTTKNTYVYESIPSDGAPDSPIRSLYIQKSHFIEAPPDMIVLFLSDVIQVPQANQAKKELPHG